MKKLIGIALFGIMAFSATAFEAHAASYSARPDTTRKELKKFDKFLKHHRAVENDLRANPQAVNDAQYMSRHKDLEKFLRKNPRVTTDLSSDPNYFVDRETRYQQNKHHRGWWY